jgi:8-oxo-dGTP diphosphatase
MKRLGVAGIIRSGGHHSNHLLMGRRAKDPNRDLYVIPGGGVEDGETLEQALAREIKEETGLILVDDPYRWLYGVDIIELPDRIILVAHGSVEFGDQIDGTNDLPRDGDDLFNVGWYPIPQLPWDISPVVVPVLERWGFFPGKKPE